MQALATAQRAYDRALPPEDFDLDEDDCAAPRDVAKLAAHEVVAIVERFIALFASSTDHNFICDMGGAEGDLDDIAQALAKRWLVDAASVQAVVGSTFWQTMKQAALVAWRNDLID